jgi:hypothetical protein
MSERPLSLQQIEKILSGGPRNVVELVDELLNAFQFQAMRLKWEDGECQFQCLPLGSSELCSLPLPRSIFRTILARLAALCNEHLADSVSPYGGDGEFLWKSQGFRVAFSNNNQQGCHLEIFPVEQLRGNSQSQEESVPRGN